MIAALKRTVDFRDTDVLQSRLPVSAAPLLDGIEAFSMVRGVQSKW